MSASSDGPKDSLTDILKIDNILREISDKLGTLIAVSQGRRTPTTRIDVGDRTVEVETEDQIHRENERDIATNNVSEEFIIPTQSQKLVVHVTDADEAFSIDVNYQTAAGRTRTKIDSGDDADLAGGSGSPVYVRLDPASPFVEVVFNHDGAGSKNEVNYSILAN